MRRSLAMLSSRDDGPRPRSSAKSRQGTQSSYSNRIASGRQKQFSALSIAQWTAIFLALACLVIHVQIMFHARLARTPSTSLILNQGGNIFDLKTTSNKMLTGSDGNENQNKFDRWDRSPKSRRKAYKLLIFDIDTGHEGSRSTNSRFDSKPRIVDLSKVHHPAMVSPSQSISPRRRRMRHLTLLDTSETNPLLCQYWNSEHLTRNFYRKIGEELPALDDDKVDDGDPRPSYLLDDKCHWTGPEWQMRYRPNCLPIHEMDLTQKGIAMENEESDSDESSGFHLDRELVYKDSDEDDDYVYEPPNEQSDETMDPGLVDYLQLYEGIENSTKSLEFHEWQKNTNNRILASQENISLIQTNQMMNYEPHGIAAEYLASGNVRDVWKTFEFDGTPRVLKTLQLTQPFDHAAIDRHRIDAMAYEHLSSSPYVVDIYAHCANSAVFNFGSGGDLTSRFPKLYKEKPQLISSFKSQKSENTRLEDAGNSVIDENDDDDNVNAGIAEFEREMADHKLHMQIAYNISLALVDLHELRNLSDVMPNSVSSVSAKTPIASMVHTDLKPDQIVFEDGSFKLTDLNRARFLGWNSEKDSLCGTWIEGERQGGIWRAPEQYIAQQRADENDSLNVQVNETDRTDMFSFGNILSYMLHGGHSPYPVVRAYSYTKEYISKIAAGEPVPRQVTFRDLQRWRRRRRQKEHSVYDRVAFVYEDTMQSIIDKCFEYNPLDRPTALDVSEMLRQGLEELMNIHGDEFCGN